MLAFGRATLAAKQLPFYIPEVITVIKPKFVSGTDVLAGEERDVRKSEVLVRGEHSTGKQIRLTVMVYEAADVAVETCINAVHITHLTVQTEKIGVILSDICFGVRDDLTHVFANKCSLRDIL